MDVSNLLTLVFGLDYALSAGGVPPVGFDSLNGAANSRKRNVWRFFYLVSGVPFMAGRAGKPQGLPVLHRSVNPALVCHPSFNNDGGGFQPQMEHTS